MKQKKEGNMNKHLIIIGIVILLLVVGISGCNEKKIEIMGDTDKVEMVNYTIEVFDKDNEKIGDSFNHGGKANLYKIKGTVRNIAGVKLGKTWISLRLNDRNNNYLDSRIYLIPEIEINKTANFSLTFTYNPDYFDKIWNLYFIYIAVRG